MLYVVLLQPKPRTVFPDMKAQPPQLTYSSSSNSLMTSVPAPPPRTVFYTNIDNIQQQQQQQQQQQLPWGPAGNNALLAAPHLNQGIQVCFGAGLSITFYE